ncbi:mitochondrial thioredoxin [Sporothrix epigloea]|uniref:Thioredoxin n=1 Tax=Sporothrix epigloea TaxID=1892477 RepID=A0ABP0D974_9PEZI
MVVHEVSSFDSFKSISKVNKIVVVDFHATWCGPCKAISPLFEKLSNEDKFSGIFFAKVDVDAVPQVAQEYGIRAMPTFISIKDEEKFGEVVGANPPAVQKLLSDALAAL